jgi:hypothetical protein
MMLLRAHGTTGRRDAHSSILSERQENTKMEILFLKINRRNILFY